MSHVSREKTKLLNRLRRLRGQIEAIERAVGEDQECARVLQQATACRGADSTGRRMNTAYVTRQSPKRAMTVKLSWIYFPIKGQ